MSSPLVTLKKTEMPMLGANIPHKGDLKMAPNLKHGMPKIFRDDITESQMNLFAETISMLESQINEMKGKIHETATNLRENDEIIKALEEKKKRFHKVFRMRKETFQDKESTALVPQSQVATKKESRASIFTYPKLLPIYTSGSDISVSTHELSSVDDEESNKTFTKKPLVKTDYEKELDQVYQTVDVHPAVEKKMKAMDYEWHAKNEILEVKPGKFIPVMPSFGFNIPKPKIYFVTEEPLPQKEPVTDSQQNKNMPVAFVELKICDSGIRIENSLIEYQTDSLKSFFTKVETEIMPLDIQLSGFSVMFKVTEGRTHPPKYDEENTNNSASAKKKALPPAEVDRRSTPDERKNSLFSGDQRRQSPIVGTERKQSPASYDVRAQQSPVGEDEIIECPIPADVEVSSPAATGDGRRQSPVSVERQQQHQAEKERRQSHPTDSLDVGDDPNSKRPQSVQLESQGADKTIVEEAIVKRPYSAETGYNQRDASPGQYTDGKEFEDNKSKRSSRPVRVSACTESKTISKDCDSDHPCSQHHCKKLSALGENEYWLNEMPPVYSHLVLNNLDSKPSSYDPQGRNLTAQEIGDLRREVSQNRHCIHAEGGKDNGTSVDGMTDAMIGGMAAEVICETEGENIHGKPRGTVGGHAGGTVGGHAGGTVGGHAGGTVGGHAGGTAGGIVGGTAGGTAGRTGGSVRWSAGGTGGGVSSGGGAYWDRLGEGLRGSLLRRKAGEDDTYYEPGVGSLWSSARDSPYRNYYNQGGDVQYRNYPVTPREVRSEVPMRECRLDPTGVVCREPVPVDHRQQSPRQREFKREEARPSPRAPIRPKTPIEPKVLSRSQPNRPKNQQPVEIPSATPRGELVKNTMNQLQGVIAPNQPLNLTIYGGPVTTMNISKTKEDRGKIDFEESVSDLSFEAWVLEKEKMGLKMLSNKSIASATIYTGDKGNKSEYQATYNELARQMLQRHKEKEDDIRVAKQVEMKKKYKEYRKQKEVERAAKRQANLKIKMNVDASKNQPDEYIQLNKKSSESQTLLVFKDRGNNKSYMMYVHPEETLKDIWGVLKQHGINYMSLTPEIPINKTNTGYDDGNIKEYQRNYQSNKKNYSSSRLNDPTPDAGSYFAEKESFMKEDQDYSIASQVKEESDHYLVEE